ncbi:hypothetical protein [Peribacillus butanolivorans]
MTKRKGLLDVEVDVRGLLEEIPVSSSIASKPKKGVNDRKCYFVFGNEF